MFNFLKSKKETQSKPSQSWTEKLKKGLQRSRTQFTDHLANLILGKKVIDDALLENLENTLILADVGIQTTQALLKKLSQKVNRKELEDPHALNKTLKQEVIPLLSPYSQTLLLTEKPFVILVIGVNGVGKTTSIAKMAHYFQLQHKRVLLAAGDTFRAAAVEQLKTWGERNDIPVIAQDSGADSASVIYDAMESALAKNVDVLIADTAGRLHTQENLMEELKKIKRVLGKLKSDAPHEVLLVLDASQGQNVLNQAKQFKESMNVQGVILTKLDGTAKGGIVLALADQIKLPIRFIGVGEQIDDLKPFQAEDFVEALFEKASG